MSVELAEAPPAAVAPLAVVPLDRLPAGQHPFVHAEAALAEDYSLESGLPLRYEYSWQHLNRGRHAELALQAGAMTCVDPITGTLLTARCRATG
jgi:hypothetical protein